MQCPHPPKWLMTDGNWYAATIKALGDQPDVFLIEYAGSGIQEYVYGANLQRNTVRDA